VQDYKKKRQSHGNLLKVSQAQAAPRIKAKITDLKRVSLHSKKQGKTDALKS
jgi:hypothetical protein